MVPEFRGIAFTLDCSPEPAMLAARGFEMVPPLDWRALERRANAAMSKGVDAALARSADAVLPRSVNTADAPPTLSPPPLSPTNLSPTKQSSHAAARARAHAAASRLSPPLDAHAERALGCALGAPFVQSASLPGSLPSLPTSLPPSHSQRIRASLSCSSFSGVLGGVLPTGNGSCVALSQAAAAAEAAASLNEAVAQLGWRTRLRKRGHLFCRVFNGARSVV
eukprot:4101413-Pleurochrysis_carterae.AAC.1